MFNDKIKKSDFITKKDLRKIFWRSFSYEWSWNYERQGNLGFTNSILPSLKKIHSKNEEKLKESLQRHLEFYNITPWISTFPMGIALSMEEEYAKSDEFKKDSINGIKLALMGPLSGIGDAFFWGTLRVIATGIGVSLALKGNFLGPILFLLIFNIPAILIRYYGIFLGYNLGSDLVIKIQKTNLIDKITYASSILSLSVIGSMIATMVNINMPLKIGEGESAVTLQSIFDSIIPGILTLLFTFFIYFLGKKNIKFYWILILILIIAIVGSYTGLLGTVDNI